MKSEITSLRWPPNDIISATIFIKIPTAVLVKKAELFPGIQERETLFPKPYFLEVSAHLQEPDDLAHENAMA
jgi:hypothetical protein